MDRIGETGTHPAAPPEAATLKRVAWTALWGTFGTLGKWVEIGLTTHRDRIWRRSYIRRARSPRAGRYPR